MVQVRLEDDLVPAPPQDRPPEDTSQTPESLHGAYGGAAHNANLTYAPSDGDCAVTSYMLQSVFPRLNRAIGMVLSRCASGLIRADGFVRILYSNTCAS